AGVSTESQNLTDPIDRQPLDFHRCRCRTPDRKIGVQGRSKQVCERTERSPRRLHIAKHPRMRVLPTKWSHRFPENSQQRLKIAPCDRQLRVEPASNLA